MWLVREYGPYLYRRLKAFYKPLVSGKLDTLARKGWYSRLNIRQYVFYHYISVSAQLDERGSDACNGEECI